MRKLNQRQLAWEKSLFKYSSALERGDFATVEQILEQAGQDPVLASMIAEINAVYERELLQLTPLSQRPDYTTNHHRKDVLMTTISLPAPHRGAQRWLPFTMAAACITLLFIGALLMRPTPGRDNPLAAVQAQATATATPFPSATFTATPFPAFLGTSTPLPVVPPQAGVLPPTIPPFVNEAVNSVPVGVEQCKRVGSATVFVHTRPEGVVMSALEPASLVAVFDTQQTAGDHTWDYILTYWQGVTIQGWVDGSLLEPADCPQWGAAGILVPNAGAVMIATALPPGMIQAVPVQPDTTGQWVPADGTVPTLVPFQPALPLAGTPTAYFDSTMRSGTSSIILLDDFANMPANTEVQIISAVYDGREWVYQIQNAAGATLSISQTNLIGLTALGPTSAPVLDGMCQAINTGRESVPVYSAPNSDQSQSMQVNNLPPNTPANVLYQLFNRTTGENWFLVLALLPEGKQISGWVSIDTVSLVGMACPSAQP